MFTLRGISEDMPFLPDLYVFHKYYTDDILAFIKL